MLSTMSPGAWAGALATTAFSASPLVQRDLHAADASCSPDPLVRAALVTIVSGDCMVVAKVASDAVCRWCISGAHAGGGSASSLVCTEFAGSTE